MSTIVIDKQRVSLDMFRHDDFKKFLTNYNLELMSGTVKTTRKFVVKIAGARVTRGIYNDKFGLAIWGTGQTLQEAVNDYIKIISTNLLLIGGLMIVVPPFDSMPEGPKVTKAASYAIPIVGNSVLLLLRKKWLEEGTPLIFPGGENNEGETDLECAIRELKEETGVTVLSDTLKYLMTESTKWTNKITFFTCPFETMFFPHSEKEHDKFFGHIWLDLSRPISWAIDMIMPGAQMAILNLVRKTHMYSIPEVRIIATNFKI